MANVPVRTMTATCDHRLLSMQQIAENHLPLVGSLVRRFPRCGAEPEELYQQGCVGLMKAIARYDPGMGTAFSTYAAAMIIGEMRMLARLYAPIHIPRPERELRARIKHIQADLTAILHREPTLQELSASLRVHAEDLILIMEDISVSSTDAVREDGQSVFACIRDPDDWQTRMELMDLLEHLDEPDRSLMHCRCIEGLSQAETGRCLGLSQIQVSRRECVIRRRLRNEWYIQ